MATTLPRVSAAAYVQGDQPITHPAGFRIAELKERPGAILLDFATARQMALSIERISIFVETFNQQGLPTGPEMEDLRAAIGLPCDDPQAEICGIASGHDLRMTDVAAFYTAAAAQREPLTTGESALRTTLERADLLQRRGTAWRANERTMLVAMSRSTNLQERLDTFRHEACHIDFMLDQQFAARVTGVWNNLPADARRFVRGTLTAPGLYHRNNEALLITEAHAYFSTDNPVRMPGPSQIFFDAAHICINAPSNLECDDFLSYQGNVATLAAALYRSYRTFSTCHVPLLATGRVERDKVVVDPLPTFCSSATAEDHSMLESGLSRAESDATQAALQQYDTHSDLCRRAVTLLTTMDTPLKWPTMLWEIGSTLWSRAMADPAATLSPPPAPLDPCGLVVPQPPELQAIQNFVKVQMLLAAIHAPEPPDNLETP